MKKISAGVVALFMVLLSVFSVSPANAAEYYSCRKGTHSFGTYNWLKVVQASYAGYTCQTRGGHYVP